MIDIPLNPANPGHFFACCGLFELADRLWPHTTAVFNQSTFSLIPPPSATNPAPADLYSQLAKCTLANTMTPEQKARWEELSAMKGGTLAKTPGLEDEKKSLEKLLREAPIVLDSPFHLRLDWFLDDNAGGSRFKTWAGRQSVLDIASSMKTAIETPPWRELGLDQWLTKSVTACGLPFNFDSDLGGQGSALDIGFSFDPLAANVLTRIEPSARPLLELLAFIGLQRFRPRQLDNDNRYLYVTWNQPLTTELAAPAANGLLPLPDALAFEFRLLYRTKYLKSFLPAIPYTGDSHE